MPGCSDEEFSQVLTNTLDIFNSIKQSQLITSSDSIQNISDMKSKFEDYHSFSDHYSSDELADALVNSLGVSLRVYEPVLLFCSCSTQTARRSAKLLMKSEEGDKPDSSHEGSVNVNCEWCGKCYTIPHSEIES